MLFPAVHQLGVKTGRAIFDLWYHSRAPPTPSEILEFIKDAPLLYKEWWVDLVSNDPLHVVVETLLILSIVYMVMSRNTEGYKHMTEKLSEREQQDLLREWKERDRLPLTPSTDTEDESGADSSETPSIVVHKQHGRFMEIETHGAKSPRKEGDPDLLKVLNFATFDFLGMQMNDETNPIKLAAKEALDIYGCGSCGPRGFYGTIDTHLTLEDQISKFTGTEGAIMYSDGASTCSSTVAAFAKRGDLLVVDEGVYEPIMTGVMLSRANIKWFRHNDMEDLERVLKEVQESDKKLRRKPNAQRRFIVAEGLYKNLGTICPVDQLVELKHKYHYRLILDESFSFGTLGDTGKGVLQLHGKRNMYDAEIVTIALENAVGSIGGVTVGNEEVVDHQRLSGAGYCYSASAPPFTATAASAALKRMGTNPEVYQALRRNVRYVYDKLKPELQATLAKLNEPVALSRQKKRNQQVQVTTPACPMVITSDERSPIVVVQFEHEIEKEAELLNNIVRGCLSRGVAVVSTGKQVASTHLSTELAPAIRLTVSALHTTEDIDSAVSALCQSILETCRA